LAEALADGDLSLEAVAPLAEFATPETEAELAQKGPHLSVKQARELARSLKPPTDDAAARAFEHRTLRLNDANCTIWAALTKDDYALVKAGLIARASASAAADDGRGDRVRFDQRLCDALVDLFRSADGVRVGTGVGTGVGKDGAQKGYRPTVVVHADLGLLTGLCPSGVAEIAGLDRISREVARRLACDAAIVFSVERHDGCILDQKRARRSPTSAQRREIARRDKGCRFPNCSFENFTQVHHVVHWTSGGETNQDNLITLCHRHHQAVHELGWKMQGDADDVMTFTSPHGHVMTSVPSPTWRQSMPMRR
jgi:hypothetical protein